MPVSYTHLVDWNGGFVEYELQAAEGNLDVTRNYYHYEDEMMRKKTEEHFTEMCIRDSSIVLRVAWVNSNEYFAGGQSYIVRCAAALCFCGNRCV